MYYANCKWYVDMGEYNKPLCERKSLRPAKCSECSVYIRSIEEENAKLRELATETIRLMQADGPDCGLCKHYDECWAGESTNYSPTGCVICNEARELGIEVD